MDETPLLEHLRAITAVPGVALSGYDRQEASRAAGASRCPRLDQWLLIGTVVAELIGASAE